MTRTRASISCVVGGSFVSASVPVVPEVQGRPSECVNRPGHGGFSS